ncbi:hypothetical protein [Candidatus Mycoplasma haematominutum]|uniref:hypothetical protein n=1 Tax=Candidatus Mycoplasma haematominutum TaxID=209446 RepID=UPI0005C69FC2|nr:hypothetical protein [Candidatus Mycoplasma haematominutum]
MLGGASIAGICSSIGVPVAAHLGKNDSRKAAINTEEKHMTSDLRQGISRGMKECAHSPLTSLVEISFGSDTVERVCWTSTSETQDKRTISALLNAAWELKNNWKGLHLENAVVYCRQQNEPDEDNSVWKSTPNDDDCQGIEYIRLKKDADELFLRKEGKSVQKIWSCQKNCWLNEFQERLEQQVISENPENWKQFSFYIN